MKIAIHLAPLTQRVEGVWLFENDVPVSYYPNGVEYPYIEGLNTMQAFIDDKGSSGVTWDKWCIWLSERIPNKIWWEEAESLQKETSKEAYERLIHEQ
jgi:hypothetical protein